MNSLLLVRSLLFYLGYTFFTVFFSLSGFLLFLFPLKIRGKYLILWNYFVLLWLRICCNIRVEVKGTYPKGAFVAAAKHQSQWETFYLQRALWPVHIVLKKELLDIPFFGWALRLVDPIAIDRKNVKTALSNIKETGSKYLKQGHRVLIFPEGTRVRAGEKNRYARSAADLAQRCGIPIVPIAHNAGYCWPSDSLIKHPGVITVSFGEPIESAEKSSKELILSVESWIEQECTVLGNGRYD